MDKAIRQAVLAAAIAGARAAAASPNIAIEPSAVGAVADRVTQELAPEIEHLSNGEPWYLSRVTWGALLSAVGATSALLGYPIAEEMQSRVLEAITLWTAFGGLVSGPALTLWGRWAARKRMRGFIGAHRARDKRFT